MQKGVSLAGQILLGIAACFIAGYLITHMLRDANGWTGFEDPVLGPPEVHRNQQRNVPAQIPTNAVTHANFILTAAAGAPAVIIPQATGKEFSKFDINDTMFMEGHWWGMEVENLTPLARRILKIPDNIQGLWVDETNLWAVRSGINAADIITSVGGFPVRSLGEFYMVTKRVRNRRRVKIDLLRGSAVMTVTLDPGTQLGIAAMESAEGVDPMNSDAAIDPLDMVEGAPKSFTQKGYKALVTPVPAGVTPLKQVVF